MHALRMHTFTHLIKSTLSDIITILQTLRVCTQPSVNCDTCVKNASVILSLFLSLFILLFILILCFFLCYDRRVSECRLLYKPAITMHNLLISVIDECLLCLFVCKDLFELWRRISSMHCCHIISICSSAFLMHMLDQLSKRHALFQLCLFIYSEVSSSEFLFCRVEAALLNVTLWSMISDMCIYNASCWQHTFQLL